MNKHYTTKYNNNEYNNSKNNNNINNNSEHKQITRSIAIALMQETEK